MNKVKTVSWIAIATLVLVAYMAYNSYKSNKES